MAEPKPIFALDLSNDGITLWHRNGGGGWITLGQIPLDAPDIQNRMKMMRAKAGISHNKPIKAAVQIPRSEVMISRLKLGVFEGDAALSHARKLIGELTPYPLKDIVYDLDGKGVGNMAPVAVVARQTLEEAEHFAAQYGFEALYFTTQFEPREFPREPRFYLKVPRKPILPLLSRIAAGVAIGLTIGYYGYINFVAPTAEIDTPVALVQQPATPTPVVAPKPAPEVAPQPESAVSNPQKAPNFPAGQVATLIAPETTDYPEIVIGDVGRSTLAHLERLARPTDQTGTKPPQYQAASSFHKTDDLALAEAHRDLPDLALDDDVLAAHQDEMALNAVAEHVAQPALQVAAFTPPEVPYDGAILSLLMAPAISYDQPPQDARSPADPPPPPPAPITAEPGTLIPTPEGTPGPKNILIFSGKPPVLPRARPVIAPPPDPLAGFRARPRPADLISPEQLALLETQVENPTPQVTATQPDQPTSPEATATSPDLPADLAARQPATLPVLRQPAARTDTVTNPANPQSNTSLTALADPALAGFRPRARPQALAPTPAEITPQVLSLLDLADPALANKKARARPQEFTAAPVETTPQAPSLLNLADPALAGKRPRSRPANLKLAPQEDPNSLIARADPTLSRYRAKRRPSNLKIIRPVVETPLETPSINTLNTATRLAVARSPKPKKRPNNLAIIAAITSDGDTRATGGTPKRAKGTSKPTPGKTVVSVAKAATEKSRFNKRKMSLVGVFGTPNARRALVRMPSGRYVKVKTGDRLSGWKVSAIGESSLRIRKGTKNQVLRMP